MNYLESLLSFLFLVIVAFVLLVPVYFRWRERMTLLQLVRTTAEAGQPLTAETIHALRGGRMPSASRDLRRGAILLGLGIGVFLIGISILATASPGQGRDGFVTVLCAAGIVPACIGVAFLFLALAERKLVKD